MRLEASLSRNLIIVILILGAGVSSAQIDTVYIRTKEATSVSIGNASVEFSFGLARMARKVGEKLNVAIEGRKFDVDLVAGKRQLLDLTVSPYRLLDIQKTSSDNSVSITQLTRYYAAQSKKSTTLAFDYLEKFKKGYFTTDALALINALNADEQLQALTNAMAKENYYLAADLALGLINNPGTKHLSKSRLLQMNALVASVAGFLDKAGTLAINGGQYQKGIELYKKSNRLTPRNDLPERISKAEKADEQERFLKLMSQADSLEKINALSETVRSLQRASDIRHDEEINRRIERLDIQMQDSLYQKAVVSDKKEQFVFYRKKGYLTYLSRYPNGKYAENAGARITRLNKDQHRVNKIGAFYGWGTVGFQGDKVDGSTYTSINNFGIARITETRYFGLDFGFNQDFFDMNKLSASGEIDTNNLLEPILLTEDFNDKEHYVGAFTASASFAMLFYKARKLRLFAGGNVGWGQMKTWLYGYKFNILTDKPPYTTAGKNAYYYQVESERLTTDLPHFGILFLAEFKGVMLKGSLAITQPTITNFSIGYAF